MEAIPGLPPGSPSAAPVAGAHGGQPPATAAGASSAAASASLFGGLATGRKRRDGLTPGSPEAIEEDRRKWRERKRRLVARRSADPAPLPSAGGAPGPEDSAPGDSVGDSPDLEGAAPIPWTPELLKPVFDQLIPVAEEMAVRQITSRAAKAGLPGLVLKEIETDSRFNPIAKKSLELSAPEVAAELLNDAGISSKNKARVVLFTSLGAIAANHVRILRRLDQLVALHQAPTSKPAPASAAAPASPPAKPAAAAP